MAFDNGITANSENLNQDTDIKIQAREMVFETPSWEIEEMYNMTAMLCMDVEMEQDLAFDQDMDGIEEVSSLPVPGYLEFMALKPTLRQMAAIQGWFYKSHYYTEPGNDAERDDAARDLYFAFDPFSGLHAEAGEIFRENYDFISQATDMAFSGVLFTDYEDFAVHPGIDRTEAFNVFQSIVASKASNTDPILHIHREGPETEISDEDIVKMESDETLPVERHRIETIRVVRFGTPFLISVIHGDHRRFNHQLKLDRSKMMAEVPEKILDGVAFA